MHDFFDTLWKYHSWYLLDIFDFANHQVVYIHDIADLDVGRIDENFGCSNIDHFGNFDNYQPVVVDMKIAHHHIDFHMTDSPAAFENNSWLNHTIF